MCNNKSIANLAIYFETDTISADVLIYFQSLAPFFSENGKTFLTFFAYICTQNTDVMAFELSYLVGPLVGGVIGYITNDVAIRMLFRPHKAKYVMGLHVPFTPGIIPKERGRIAQAVGQAISDNLMNREVLERTLLSEEMMQRLGDSIDRMVSKQTENNETLEQLLRHYLTREELQAIVEGTSEELSRLVKEKLTDTSVGQKIAHQAIAMMKEKTHRKMGGFLTDALGLNKIVEAALDPAEHHLARHINDIMSQNAEQMVATMLDGEADRLLQRPVSELLRDHEQQLSELRQTALGLYRTVITDRLPRILGALNISRIIENRINEMDMDESERIILDVMKKELRAIVWFGALLGCLIGIVNALL